VEKTMKESLKEALDEAEWSWLLKHSERNVVIVVQLGLDILEAAEKIATDDAATVAAWIASNHLSRPTSTQLLAWNAEPTKKFMSLVVQPYVLVQEILH
jgi:hypothetical protein